MPLITDYVTLSELKSFLRITDTGDDAELALAITTASRVIDQAAGRRFGQDNAPTTRYYTAPDATTALEVDDIATLTGLSVTFDGDAVTINTDYRAVPYNATADGQPFTRLELVNGIRFPTDARAIAVTATFGWPSVPAAIRNATLVQAGTILKGGRDSPLGIAGSPEFGNELRLSTRLHPIAAEAIRPYQRLWGVV